MMRRAVSSIMPLLTAIGLALLAGGGAIAADERADAMLRESKAAVGRELPDVAFTDTDGAKVRLSDYRGKPLLVTLVYTGCADVCPTLIENLVPAVRVARDALGDDSFSVITIGFDLRQDSPEQLRAFARARGAVLSNWKFLASDAESLDALARTIGFGFYRRPGGFDHFSQVSIVDADGRLYQQVYGGVFEPPQIVEPLKNLVFNRSMPLQSVDRLLDRVRFFCTIYDPNSGRYYFNYSLFMNIGIGSACFGWVLLVLVREWRKTNTNV